MIIDRKCPICGKKLKQCLVPTVIGAGASIGIVFGGPIGVTCGAAISQIARKEVLAKASDNGKQRYYCVKCKQYIEL